MRLPRLGGRRGGGQRGGRDGAWLRRRWRRPAHHARGATVSGWGRCLHPGQCTPVPAQPARRPLPGGWALLVPLWHSQCRCLPAGCPIATLSFSTRMWLCLQGWTSPCLPHCRCTMRNMPVCMYSIHQPSPPPHPTPPHPTPPHPTPPLPRQHCRCTMRSTEWTTGSPWRGSPSSLERCM